MLFIRFLTGLCGIYPGLIWDYIGSSNSPLKHALIRETSKRFLVHLFHVDKYTRMRQSVPTTNTDSKDRTKNLAHNQPRLPGIVPEKKCLEKTIIARERDQTRRLRHELQSQNSPLQAWRTRILPRKPVQF